ncbi:GntR family transcriptional regulator [Uliginosibacterium sp. H3]|uniref:GntR family transcriptional regulator n=1 Tax=Uliginosibacterium silvisoli TaxID=3114758 RepID=A0ABU6K0A9_9RHOO|nr:GntR family transcriptional regulator [Uliginosibacterium sp. H3]
MSLSATPYLDTTPATPELGVTRLSPQPMYAQIRNELRARILDGRYTPHERLPSENELIALFGVSRITVRQALGDLQREGLLFKVHGKGTYVSKPKTSQELAQLEGFAEAMGKRGFETFNRVVSQRELAADDKVAHHLQLPIGTQVIEIRRVRFLNREPISLDISYFPHAIGKRLCAADLANRDIFALLENELGIALGRAELEIGAMLADDTLAGLLQVAEGAPILRMERLTYGADGQPIDYEYLHYRADAFQYRLRVNRDAERNTQEHNFPGDVE